MNYMGVPVVVPDNHSRIMEILQTNKNNLCADCGMALTIDTAWAVLSYGIFVCDDCKLVHIQQENHCKAPNQSLSQASVTGILPASCYQHWEEKDLEQMRANGNEKVNSTLLCNIPPWQYRPMATDGIKHKEYWIKYKYGKGPGTSEEIPKTANKSFNGIQFSRRMPKGDVLPCCAVLQNERLYLTSDAKSEEIQIEDIESVLVNSKRIGKDNGVQLTYRGPMTEEGDQENSITYTYLQHENMETVLDWINLILYTKFNLLQEKHKNFSKEELANMLNCVIVKESYTSAATPGLIYVSLSEARIACFKHHLDEKPLFHLTVSKALKLSGAQYLEALAQFFEMDVSKMHGYDDWNSALEQVLKMDKLAYLADKIAKYNVQLIPPKASLLEAPVEVKAAASAPPIVDKVVQNNAITEPVKEVAASVTPPLPHEEKAPAAAAASRGPTMNDKGEEKSNKKYECYPPIGPMGEMGKVARGELPPEAIRPAMPKIDQTRVQMFGMANPMTASMSTPLGHSAMSMPSITTMNMTQQTSHTPSTDCYPPISGPIREMPEAFQSLPRMTQNDESYPVIDKFDPMHSSYRNQDRRGRVQMQYEPEIGQFARMNSTNGVQSPTEMHNIHHHPLTRSTSWSQSGAAAAAARSVEWQMKQELLLQQKSAAFRNQSSHEHMIADNLLQQQWVVAEKKLMSLIHNGYVPASNMSAAGLDANSLDHAQTCITELFDLLWKKRYDLALSFLRGFREVFSRSQLHEIRNQFIGVGELDTMKGIFMHQGREKILKASMASNLDSNVWNGGAPAVKSQFSVPTLENSVRSPVDFAVGRDNDYSPWGLPDNQGAHKFWGSTPTTPATAPPLSTDPWSVGALSVASSQSVNGNRPFNRAPSRPVSLSRSSFSEPSPTDGSFDSKASSNSASPGVITPPTSLEAAVPTPALTGIETTLRNLFLNTSSGSGTLWN